jgi:hypothetical protein
MPTPRLLPQWNLCSLRARERELLAKTYTFIARIAHGLNLDACGLTKNSAVCTHQVQEIIVPSPKKYICEKFLDQTVHTSYMR